MDKIILPEINAMGNHGLTQAERLIKQPFVISVQLDLDLLLAAASDNIEDTLDYGQLYQRIKTEVETKRFCLIEALAGSIADIIMEDRRVAATEVKVEKAQARSGNNLFRAAVVISRKRNV